MKFENLLNDMLEFDVIKWHSRKAQIVYWKCIHLGKVKLADKIEAKYSYPFRSDLVIVMQYSLMASNQLNQKQ